MATKRLADEWNSYRENVMPADAGPEQAQEARRAFYAGATSMFFLMVRVGEGADPNVVTENELAVVDGWHDELVAFLREIEEGRA